MKSSFPHARRVAAVLGCLVMLGVSSARAEERAPVRDPLATPLWQQAGATVNVADALPMRKSKYQMVSLALSTDVATVASTFNDDLGSYNPDVWRLGHWEPTRSGTNKYIEPSTLANIVRGQGYWLITKDSTTVVDFDRPSANPDTIELPLYQAPGGVAEWNQLGNPFAFNSAVTNWRVVKRDSLLTLNQAASANWIEANMRTWDPDNQQYTASGTISRYRGFWARLIDPDITTKWVRWLPHDTVGNAGYWSTVRLDSKGNPHISFFFNSQLRYVTRVGNNWIKNIVEIPGNFANSETAIFSNVDLDSLDMPYIAEMQWNPYRPAYTRKLANGTWTPTELIEPGPTNNGWGIKLKMFHGGPRVAYGDNGNGLIKYAERTVSGWNVEPVSGLGSVPNQVNQDLGFDLSKSGVPHIATVSKNSPYGLRYFTKTGGVWVSELVDSLPTGSTGLTPSLAVDNNGVPHISYFDQQNVDLKYARRVGANNWAVETVDATGNTGNFSEIMIQPNGQPAIAFLEYASTGVPNRIRYATRTGAGSWSIETVDDVGVSAGQAYLGATLDSGGNPRITYQGNAAGQLQLRYAEKIDGHWRIKVPPVPAPEPALANGLVKPDGAEWAVAVTAREGNLAAEPMFVGAAAPENLAALRSSRAPAPPSGAMVSLYVDTPNEALLRDFQPEATTMRWPVRFDGGDTPGERTLQFQGLDLPAGMRLYLEDVDRGLRSEIHSGDRVTLVAQPRNLALIATTEADGLPVTDLTTKMAFAYPNPFAARTGLAFTLSREADIRVELFDVSGRRVQTLERTRASAGEHVLVWDGHDASGRTLPSGVYLARWRAGDVQGTRRLIKLD